MNEEKERKRMEKEDLPFQRLDKNLGSLGWIRLCLGLLTLVPIRLACLFIVLVSFSVILWCLTVLNVKHKHIRAVTRFAARSTLFLCGFLTIEVEFSPKEKSQERPLLLVSNHVSYVEILYFMSSKYCPSFVMKESTLQLPFIGSIANALGGIPVGRSRTSKESASEQIAERIVTLRNRTHPQPICIFPEGTTTNGAYLLPFKTGAFRCGEAVLPVLVQYPLQEGGFSLAYESISTPVHFVRMLSAPSNTMKVKYLDIYHPSPAEKADPAKFAANVRQVMAQASGAILTQQTFKDKLLFHQELRKHYVKLGKWSLFRYVRPDLVVKDNKLE